MSAATSGRYDTLAFSYPRGSGKSWLSGHLVSRIMNPADSLFRPGTESVLLSGSIEQCRIVFRFAREVLEPMGGYRFVDSATRVAITHPETHTRLRVIGSNARTTFGLVQCPWVIWDEPGAAEVNAGELLFDAVMTSQGKVGSPLTVLFAGTLAPALRGWWPNLVRSGTTGTTYVQYMHGDPKRWDVWQEILRCNPLARIDAKFRAKLLQERDAARRDSRLRARFLSYRLNVPSEDEAAMLLTVEDWERVTAREVPQREEQPIVGVDLGNGRAWSAAVAAWKNGRTEAIAVAPGLPSIDEQERRDQVPTGTYRRLKDNGSLLVADGVRVPGPDLLMGAVRGMWGQPALYVADYFNVNALRDVADGVVVEPRRALWSQASEDVGALRKMALDGPLSVATASRHLLTASLAASMVSNDSSGNTRMVKRSPQNNVGRDDVAAALVLAAGALAREQGAGETVFLHASL